MEHLDVLLDVFPEAHVIQTHRDPRKTMGSFCSMVAHARGVFSDHVDTHEVAEHWVRKVRRLMERSIAVRERRGNARFVDVAYADLIADPVAQVERIYASAGLDWDASVREAVEAVAARDTQHRYGRHVYRLEDFGLDDARIEAELGFYRERYAIAREPGSSSSLALVSDTALQLGHRNPVTATVAGLVDLLQPRDDLQPLSDDERLDGQSCLVTGASSGLGKGIALALAGRGARLILPVRSGHRELAREIVERSGNPEVEVMEVDLADLESVHRLCDELRDRGETISRAILNAGLMPRRARKTAQGHEIMFGVHFLANRLLLDRWLADGVLVPGAKEGGGVPRVIFVGSESHRSSPPIDFDHFGEFVDYGIMDGMTWYGSSKLHLSTFAVELSRRLNAEGEPVRVGVHHLCPGPVDSEIGREAPGPVKVLLRPLMRLFFKSPARAAIPVEWLACARELEGRTGVYLHMKRRKRPSPLACDPDNGRRLWEQSAALIARLRPG
jgi:NAD(P)-dependent dehydrogenase (short-subunit alcohol dehydrogenase family)